MHVGEPEVATLKAVGEQFVVNAHQVQNGGVQVVHMDTTFDDVRAKVVGGAVNVPRLDASTSHPNGEAACVMIAAKLFERQIALRIGCTAEFAAPNHQGVVQ